MALGLLRSRCSLLPPLGYGLYLLSYPDPPGLSYNGMSCWGTLGATAYSPMPAPGCYSTLTAKRKRWSQPLSLILGSSTGHGPSVGSASAPGPAEWVQGPGDGFNIRRAWLQNKREPGSDPAPSLTGPGTARKVVRLLSTSSRWDAERMCCCSCGWSGLSGCPQQGPLQPR